MITLNQFFDISDHDTISRLVHAARMRYNEEHGAVTKMEVDTQRGVVVVNGAVEYNFKELI